MDKRIGKNIIFGSKPKYWQWQVIEDDVVIGENVTFGPWNRICQGAIIGNNVKFGKWSKVLAGEIVPDNYELGDHEIYPMPPRNFGQNMIHGGGNIGMIADWFLSKEFRDHILKRGNSDATR